jgi:hypothetical protein
MRHVEQSTRRISLYPHISRLGEASKRSESAGTGNLGLVLFVRCKIGDASDSVALHLNIRRQHLSNERSQSTKLDNKDLVIGCSTSSQQLDEFIEVVANALLTARFPRAALAALCTSISGLCRRKRIGSKVSRSTSRTSVCAMISSNSAESLRSRAT